MLWISGQIYPSLPPQWTQDINSKCIRRLGRLLKVLCTFNLRPVPRGLNQLKKPVKTKYDGDMTYRPQALHIKKMTI